MADAEDLMKDHSHSDWPEWEWFDSVEEILKGTVAKVRENEGHEIGVLYPLLDSISESAESLRTLASSLKLRDSYVIARVIYETSVNACFLLTNPEAISERAHAHAKQKALRNLTRAIELAGDVIFEFKPQGAEEFLGNSQHQAWLSEFTSRSGREITSWTPENVQQRLEAVYLKFGESKTRGLAFGLLLYRNASEIAHGTLFGTLFSWGAMEIGRPLRAPEDLGRFRRREFRHLLRLVSYSLESLICLVNLASGDSGAEIAARRARTDYYEKRGGYA